MQVWTTSKLPSFVKEKRHDKGVWESDLDPIPGQKKTWKEPSSRTRQFSLSSCCPHVACIPTPLIPSFSSPPASFTLPFNSDLFLPTSYTLDTWPLSLLSPVTFHLTPIHTCTPLFRPFVFPSLDYCYSILTNQLWYNVVQPSSPPPYFPFLS